MGLRKALAEESCAFVTAAHFRLLVASSRRSHRCYQTLYYCRETQQIGGHTETLPGVPVTEMWESTLLLVVGWLHTILVTAAQVKSVYKQLGAWMFTHLL